MAGCAAQVRERSELNRHHLDEVSRETDLPAVVLPFLTEGVRGLEDLRQLGAPLLDGRSRRAA